MDPAISPPPPARSVPKAKPEEDEKSSIIELDENSRLERREMLTRKLATELGPRLYRYFYASFDADLASDLVQEVFLRLLPKIRQGAIDPERGDLVTYSFGIAHNVRKEALRGLRRRFALPLESGAELVSNEPISENLEERRQIERLKAAVKQLKKPEAEIISLLLEEDLSMEAIARITGHPVGTVKSHIHRARIRLKNILDPVRPS